MREGLRDLQVTNMELFLSFYNILQVSVINLQCNSIILRNYLFVSNFKNVSWNSELHTSQTALLQLENNKHQNRENISITKTLNKFRTR